ncbi:MAG: DMT family transporter [Anaerolineales bacterium]|nr:DMT family transporter [Anaerolineales bacterium]
MQRPSSPSPSLPIQNRFALITVLTLVDSLHFVFARLLLQYISPGVSAMYVLAFATLEVGVFGLLSGRINITTMRRNLVFFLIIGFLVAASTNINYEAVAFIDPGTASLLSQTSIIFGLALGLWWLRDKLTRKQLLGALIAIVGVLIISFQPGDYLRLGSIMVLVSAFLYALHAAITKRYGSDIEFVDFFFFRLLCTTAFLFIFAASRQQLALPSWKAVLLLVLVGTVDVVISRTLYYVTLRRMDMSVHAIILTLSPVATVLWSLLLFSTFPTWGQMIGGAAVLLGVLIVTLNQVR